MRVKGVFAVAVAVAAAVAAFAAIAWAAGPAGEQGRFKFRGTVFAVIDGETIRVRLTDGKREVVRLVGVEAPKGNQCFAARAKARTRALTLGKRVTLEGDSQQARRDSRGRLLAYVALPGGTDLTLALLQGGYARNITVEIERYLDYFQPEDDARDQKRGRWGACPPDVVVTVSDAPDPVAVGQPIRYIVGVTNVGTGPLVSAYLDLEFVDYESDPPVRVLSATATSGWICQDQTEYVTCGLGFYDTLEAKAAVAATITVIPLVAGVLRVHALSGDELDSNPRNDTAEALTTVTAPP